MKRMSFFVVLLPVLLLVSSNMGHAKTLMTGSQKEETILKARQMLKDYGLLSCLIDIDDKYSHLKDDLKKLRGLYYFFSSGKHVIKQNQDTFETTYDTYKTVIDYVNEHKIKYKFSTLEGVKIESATCFQLYYSAEYEAFIKSQDPYIDPLIFELND